MVLFHHTYKNAESFISCCCLSISSLKLYLTTLRYYFFQQIGTDIIPFLTGEIRVELGSLEKLQVLGLAMNEFTGSIPASIFNVSTLQILDFEGNKLSGTLPSDLGRRMPNLKRLYCGTNKLSGFISAYISNSSRLTLVDLSGNSFTGPIPESLGNLQYLEVLNVGENNTFSASTLIFL